MRIKNDYITYTDTSEMMERSFARYQKHNNTYQNHIFAGASRVATKQNNTLTYNHPNHLSSNVLQTDSSGAVQYSTFIRPFGVSVGHAGTRMHSYIYTDQELDYDTGLMYYDARYYNPAFARFTSPDSVASFSPERVLSDPQSLNVYAYARDNPIVFIDPDGNEVQIVSRGVDVPFKMWDDNFSHSFISITNDVNGHKQHTTLSGTQLVEGGPLVKDMNGDMSYVSNCSSCGYVTIHPPSGVTQNKFEERIISNFNDLPDQLDEDYFAFGRGRMFDTGANCHNSVTTMLYNSGIKLEKVQSYKDSLYQQNKRYLPGLGQTINGSTYSSTIKQDLISVLNNLKSLLTNLTK